MTTATAAGTEPGTAAPVRWSRRPSGSAQALMLVVLLALCVGAGLAASVVTRPAVAGWYQDIAKPAWTAPDIAFPFVWAALYLLMALAAWQAWRSAAHAAAGALVPFLIQLGLNAAWPYAFFGMRNFDLGFVIILGLVPALLATMVTFSQRSALAAWLMVPYLVWACYATALNAAVVQLNP